MGFVDDYKQNVAKYNSIQDVSSNDALLNELSREYTKEYYLFLIWVIITIIIIILTLLTLVSNEVNTMVWLVVVLFIAYCSFFIFKNIYYII